MLGLLTNELRQSKALDSQQIQDAVVALIDESVSPEEKADFLTALSQKGETVEELAGLASALRDKSLQPPLDAETRSREILDVCGTGGDHLNTFNISTTVALLAASAGVTVAKHGNRAVTSKSGSADVLEALGIAIDLTPDQTAEFLHRHHFAFFFAPKFHPAFRHIAAARKLCAQRGQRTVFNLLGPLLNPTRPTAQLIGVPRPQFCEPMARVLQALGIRRGMVVSGEVSNGESRSATSDQPDSAVHLDEISTLGETVLAEFYQERGLHCSTFSPKNFSLQPAALEDLKGGDNTVNAAIIHSIFSGEERGPKRDAVLINSAAALFVAGKVKSMSEGWDLALQLIESGKAKAKLQELIEGSQSIQR